MARPRRPVLEPRLVEYRQARGLTQEQVADAIGITAEMVRRHEKGEHQPAPDNRKRYSALYRASQADLGLVPGAVVGAARSATVDVEHLLAEITESGTSRDAIERIDRATTALAEMHTRAPARTVLRQVLRLRADAHELLAGPVRLSQARDIYRIESELLAHSCLLLSDLKQDDAAIRHGMAGLTFAEEAGANDAVIRSALAKTLRWTDRLMESADMARAGYARSPMAPIRLQLGCYEANAAALVGDVRRAQDVLRRVEEETSQCEQDSGVSAWSFPAARQAVFALSVATQARNPDDALQAVASADASWATGAHVNKANWAQIRIGAGIAHIDCGDLAAGIDEVRPVLDLPPELRVSTVTAYMANLTRRLRDRRFRNDRSARDLLSDVRVFTLEALPNDPR
ncbi:helix-turn-helix domain-containing protein [Pseudonocardia spinosispora]|uniref:helix-turn-helix domain-containing protein n=1 Tax=Pseudonocardia spinosispora TaxID=103441 RepID=UPI001FDF9AC7|nr:helix-turn-helix transcriptional regulator [Pseudonocardia spinosispora]